MEIQGTKSKRTNCRKLTFERKRLTYLPTLLILKQAFTAIGVRSTLHAGNRNNILTFIDISHIIITFTSIDMKANYGNSSNGAFAGAHVKAYK